MWGSARKVLENLKEKCKKLWLWRWKKVTKVQYISVFNVCYLNQHVVLFFLFFYFGLNLSNFKVLLDEGAQILPAFPANCIPDTCLLLQFTYTQFSLQSFFFLADMIEGLPSARFSLRAGKPSVAARVNMSHAAAADRCACPGWATNLNPSTGRGVHPPRGCGLSLLSQLWVWSEKCGVDGGGQ